MSVTYGITEEVYSLNGKSRISYGIAVYANADIDGTATIVTSVRDITSDKCKLGELIRQCNRLKISPIHIQDIVEDFLDN